MNHKRGRPKNQRAGCLYCKGHKHQAAKDTFDAQTNQEKRAIEADKVAAQQAEEPEYETNPNYHAHDCGCLVCYDD